VSSNPATYAQKRRSSRIEKAIPLAVQGLDVSYAPFQEEVTTVAISCHGCSYQMKQEVLPGAIVTLDLGQRANGSLGWPARARVKWVQKLSANTQPVYGIAVEFERAGNIWGISSPPEDWFPTQGSKELGLARTGRELRLVARTEPHTNPGASGVSTAFSALKKSDAAASQSPWFSELMAGITNQIQVTVSEIAAITLTNERNRMLDDFRVRIQAEAAGTIERVIETSREELARRALNLVTEATEAAVQSRHERLIEAIEQDLENAKRRMLTQDNELNQRAHSIMTRTVEQLQRTIETSRTEAAARFVSRLREQVSPVLNEAKEDLQKLVASQAVFKEESNAIYSRVTNELENSVNAKLIQTHGELEGKSSSVLNDHNEKLLALSQTFESVAMDSVQTLVASATDRAKANLEKRAAAITSSFTSELEAHVRDYLEFISSSIAEFPVKTPTP